MCVHLIIIDTCREKKILVTLMTVTLKDSVKNAPSVLVLVLFHLAHGIVLLIKALNIHITL